MDLNQGKKILIAHAFAVSPLHHDKVISRKELFRNIHFVLFFSQVPASGPKGLVKGDVMKYILANDLTPIAAKKPEPVEAVKPAPAKADKPAKKPQFEIR